MNPLPPEKPPVLSFRPRLPITRLPDLTPPHGAKLFGKKKLLAFQSGPPETAVFGGLDQLPFVDLAFHAAGIKQILFVGWNVLVSAQAQNLRDTLSLVGSKIKICIGLYGNSPHISSARTAGFNEQDGTLGDPCKLSGESDFIICLVAGDVETMLNDQLFYRSVRESAIIGIPHGFISGYLRNCGLDLPENHAMVMVAPQCMDALQRDLYLGCKGAKNEGFISSIAVRAKGDQKRYEIVRDVAIAWAIGIGSHITFGTSFLGQMTADVFTKSGLILGGQWGMSEALFEYYHPGRDISQPGPFREAFQIATGSTGTVADLLSEHGIRKFYLNCLSDSDPLKEDFLKEHFNQGYILGYPAFEKMAIEVYASISSGKEIGRIVERRKHLPRDPLQKIEEKSLMWKSAHEQGLKCEKRKLNDVDAFAAGVYISCLMAHMQEMLHHGHPISEVVCKGFLEPVDSYAPSMNAHGMARVIDSCSTMERIGALGWGPIVQDALQREMRMPRRSDEDARKIMATLLLEEGLLSDVNNILQHRPLSRITTKAD